jgi:hypothetical protein
MKGIVTGIIVTALFATGCVTVDDPANWRPSDVDVDSKYYDCLRDAQGSYSKTYRSFTNYEMLKSCMQAQGYRKREATTSEMVFHAVTSPIWVPVCLLAAVGGGNCFEKL